MDDFLDSIQQLDQDTLLWLHHLGDKNWDGFWVFITNPISWIPLFVLLFILGFRSFGIKKSFSIFMTAILVAISSLGIMHLIKNLTQRLRPIHDPEVNTLIRKVITTDGFSFVSGHSMVSFALATFCFLALHKEYRQMYLVFLFPILFAYSRLYLAVHYPTDIFFGMIAGIFIGSLFYKGLRKIIRL